MNKSQTTKLWTATVEELLETFAVNPEKGLQIEKAHRCQEKFGKNQLQTEEEKSVLEIAVDQFKSLIFLLLPVSALLSSFFGDFVEGIAIVTKNKYVWFALLLTISILLMAVYVPFLANLMSLQNPGVEGWLLVITAGLAPMLIGQILKKFKLIFRAERNLCLIYQNFPLILRSITKPTYLIPNFITWHMIRSQRSPKAMTMLSERPSPLKS